MSLFSKQNKNSLEERNIFTYLNHKNKNSVINKLFLNNCINIYLLYTIYKYFDKINVIYDEKLSFFLCYFNQTREFFIYLNEEKDLNFLNFSFINEYFNKINTEKIRYVGGKVEDVEMFFYKFYNLRKDIIFEEDYFFYILELNSKTIEYLNDNFSLDYKKKEFNNKNIKFNVIKNISSLNSLINLQIGYLTEEMRFSSNKIDKIAKEKLINIFKNFKLFYLTYNDYPVAKCEWNAYTENIFQIGGVYTDKDFRNKGFGKILISEMIKYSFYNLNYKFATLFVRKDNIKAINLYEKLGFIKNKYNLKWVILNK